MLVSSWKKKKNGVVGQVDFIHEFALPLHNNVKPSTAVFLFCWLTVLAEYQNLLHQSSSYGS